MLDRFVHKGSEKGDLMYMKKLLLSAACSSILLAASPGLAFHDGQQLDPGVAQPLLAMYQAAAMQCQMGNQMGCQYGHQIQGAAQEMLFYQSQCRQGNTQACQNFQLGAGTIYQAFQQFQGMSAPIQPDPSFGQMSHEERMRLQQQAFDAHNRQWNDNQNAIAERNRQWRENFLK